MKHPCPRGDFFFFQAGLLTSGSPYLPRLPDLSTSGSVRRSSPVTAAGPSPVHTEFPLHPLLEPEKYLSEMYRTFCGSSRMSGGKSPILETCLHPELLLEPGNLFGQAPPFLLRQVGEQEFPPQGQQDHLLPVLVTGIMRSRCDPVVTWLISLRCGFQADSLSDHFPLSEVGSEPGK